jgi:glycosyltransferase involved in cell wall biosynthesis
LIAAPSVTIVITTHDRPALAPRAIQSALSQTLRNLEVIVVDDGSTPPFEFRSADERLRSIRINATRGVCAARNIGLHAARGRWVAFLDDDDELFPLMLEVSLQAISDSSLPIPVAALSGVAVTDDSGRVVKTAYPPRLARGHHYFLEESKNGSFGVHNTLVAPRETLIDIGGWDEEIRSWEHDDLFLRLNAVCSLEAVDAITYRRGDHNQGHLHDRMLECAQGMARTMQKHRDIFALYRRHRAHYLGAMGVAYLKAGRWTSAIGATTRALIHDPRQPRLLAWWLASLAGPRVLSLYRRWRRTSVVQSAGTASAS